MDKINKCMLDLDDTHEKLTALYAEGSVEGYTPKHLGRCAYFVRVLSCQKSCKLGLGLLRHKTEMKELFKKGKKGSHVCNNG